MKRFFTLFVLLVLTFTEALKVRDCEYETLQAAIDAEMLPEPTTFDECSQYCTRNTTCTAFRHKNSVCAVVTEEMGTDVDAELGLDYHSKVSDCRANPKTARELFGRFYDDFETMVGEEGLANAVQTLLDNVNFSDLDVDDDHLISNSERDPMVEGLVNLFEKTLFTEPRTIQQVREFAVFPVADVAELDGGDLDWTCAHVYGIQDFDIQAEDEMNVSAQEFSSVVNEFLRTYLDNVDIYDWGFITFAKAQILSLNQLVIPEKCKDSERRNLQTRSHGKDYICVSGSGTANMIASLNRNSRKACGDLCKAINQCVYFDVMEISKRDSCRLYKATDRKPDGSRWFCKEDENRCYHPDYSEWGALQSPRQNYWACCSRCPPMRGLGVYDTCNGHCNCICQRD